MLSILKFGIAAMISSSWAAGPTVQNSLPKPLPPFKGKITKNYKTSKSDYPQPLLAPKGAPNILVVLIDDLGFGGASAYGGVIPTPNIDRVANRGLRYNAVHNAALCSPSRAALLSGRNHHQVGMGMIMETSTGFPGYNSVWEENAAAIPEILKYNGYSTAAFGKWHNTPDWETSSVGPFDRWPIGKGFQYFYGFQGGETSQYYPQLYENTLPVEPARTPEQGYTLNEDLADHSILWMRQQTALASSRPWFMYYAPGAMHAPHHVPEKYITQFKGKFDKGWDQYREDVFANQKKMGIIPANAKLSPRPQELPAWDTLSADQKKLYTRQMEVFAAFLVQTDEQLGRLLNEVDKTQQAENTLVILALGDNGGSPEGGLTGTLNNMATQNGFPDDVKSMLKSIDEIGGPKHENHFSAGWAWAIDTPFQWTKQVASHFGGTRSGFIVSWPKKIKAQGEVRSQWHHFVDIAPTIYEAAGVKMPEYVNGTKQLPMAGTSMVYSFNDAKAPGRHKTQYFEMFGNRAIYNDGWIASARHGVPWILVGREGDFDKDKWELYDLKNDFSQTTDVAAKYPQKLKQLQALFDKEAIKNQVYPLDDRFSERGLVPDRPSLTKGKTSFTYYAGMSRLPEGSAPSLKGQSFRITAHLNIPDKGAEGVIVAAGGSGGYSFFVKDGHLMYENNFFGKSRDLIKSNSTLPKGQVTASVEYHQLNRSWGGGGTAALFVNGKKMGEGKITRTVPVRYSATETFDIGEDTGEAVSSQYHGPFAFTGKIEKVTVDIMPIPKDADEINMMGQKEQEIYNSIQ